MAELDEHGVAAGCDTFHMKSNSHSILKLDLKGFFLHGCVYQTFDVTSAELTKDELSWSALSI